MQLLLKLNESFPQHLNQPIAFKKKTELNAELKEKELKIYLNLEPSHSLMTIDSSLLSSNFIL